MKGRVQYPWHECTWGMVQVPRRTTHHRSLSTPVLAGTPPEPLPVVCATMSIESRYGPKLIGLDEHHSCCRRNSSGTRTSGACSSSTSSQNTRGNRFAMLVAASRIGHALADVQPQAPAVAATRVGCGALMLDMHSSDDSMESFTTRDFLGGTVHNSGNSGSSTENFTTQGFLGSTTARGLGRPYYTDGGTSRTEPSRCLDYTYSGGSDIELHAFIDEMNAEHVDELRQIALVQSTADGVDWSVEQLSAAKLVQADNKGVIIQEILCSSTDQRCIAVDSACITRRTRARSYDVLH